MNRLILLLLLIISSAFTHSMEKENPSSPLISKITKSPKKSKKERPLFQFSLPFIKLTEWPTSQSIASMRANKDNLEKRLSMKDKQIKKAIKRQQDLRNIFTIGSNNLGNSGFGASSNFLDYCYYQTLHERIGLNLSDIQNLDHCKGTHASFCDYSALGAAMLAKDIPTEKKHAFIQKLIDYGFEPLNGDIELADLIVYDHTMHYEKILLHLLYTQTPATWSPLLQEVRTHIAQYLLQLLNKESSFLPDCYLNSTNTAKMPRLLCKSLISANIQFPFV